MKGPYIVVFKDYFNIEHGYLVLANSSDEAIRRVRKLYGYPIKEIISANLEVEYLIGGDDKKLLFDLDSEIYYGYQK